MQTEPTGDVAQGDVDVVAKLRKVYEDKQTEFEKRSKIREYLSKYMQALLGSEGQSERNKSFTSNLMVGGAEYVRTAKIYPDKVGFYPTQKQSPQKDYDTAENFATLVDYANAVGGYEKMVTDSSLDMVFGEAWNIQEYQIRNGKPIKIIKKHIPWENVRGFYGGTDLLVINQLTVGELVANYGEDILSKVTYGNPFNVDDSYEDVSVDLDDIINKDKRIAEVKYWDYGLKKHNVLLGGGAYMPPEQQMDGEDYFWLDDDGDAFCPVHKRVYKAPVRGYHGYGVLDLLFPLAYLETVIVNASSHAAVLASDPLLVFYADDITEMEDKWNQYLATKQVGNQSPFFLESQSNPIKADQLAFQPNINIFETWRNFVLEEATVRTRIDFKLLVDYAPTDGQQKSRKYETDKTNKFVLAANAVTDRAFAMQTIYMLKRGESEFHDKIIYLKVGDYFYSNQGAEEKELLKDKDGQYLPVPVKIREFLAKNTETEFLLTPLLDGILDDQTFFEIQDARNDMGLLMPGSPAQVKMQDYYFRKKYSNVNFVREDFAAPVPEAPQPMA
jgi:hypothetical protein